MAKKYFKGTHADTEYNKRATKQARDGKCVFRDRKGNEFEGITRTVPGQRKQYSFDGGRSWWPDKEGAFHNGPPPNATRNGELLDDEDEEEELLG